MVVNVPYPGASPETVEREIINRVEKSLQSIPQVYQIRSTASESQRADRHHLQLQEEHDRGRRRDPQRHRLGAPQAADRDARADPVARRSRRRSRSCSSRSRRSSQTHAEISRLAEDVLADRFRGIDGVATVNVNGALRRELSVLLRAREAARVQRLGHRGGERAARAEHHRAGRPREGRAGRAEHPPRRPHRVAAGVREHRPQAPRQRDRAPGPGGHGARTASPSSPASACATRIPTSASVDHPLARREHGHGGRRRSASWSTRSTRRCPRAPSSRSPRTAARTRRTA